MGILYHIDTELQNDLLNFVKKKQKRKGCFGRLSFK